MSTLVHTCGLRAENLEAWGRAACPAAPSLFQLTSGRGGMPWRPQECLSQKPPRTTLLQIRVLWAKLCGTGMGGTPRRRQGEEGLPGSSISGEAAGGWLLEKSAALFAYQFDFGFQRNRHPHPGLSAPPPALLASGSSSAPLHPA